MTKTVSHWLLHDFLVFRIILRMLKLNTQKQRIFWKKKTNKQTEHARNFDQSFRELMKNELQTTCRMSLDDFTCFCRLAF